MKTILTFGNFRFLANQQSQILYNIRASFNQWILWHQAQTELFESWEYTGLYQAYGGNIILMDND